MAKEEIRNIEAEIDRDFLEEDDENFDDFEEKETFGSRAKNFVKTHGKKIAIGAAILVASLAGASVVAAKRAKKDELSSDEVDNVVDVMDQVEAEEITEEAVASTEEA